jgi:pre-rRNA-processing protein TSR3
MSESEREVPRIFTLELRQDDPSKCTSAKMRKFGLAVSTTRSRIPPAAIVLNPTAENVLLPSDRANAIRYGLVVIDCSWNLAGGVFRQRFKGEQRKLPLLLAGNPTNYSKLSSLSSIEAVAASLYIMGFREKAAAMLSLYKWGPTFLSLNHDALEDYAASSDYDKIRNVERSYFPNQAP